MPQNEESIDLLLQFCLCYTGHLPLRLARANSMRGVLKTYSTLATIHG
jgi:hypothetical protein